MDFHRTLLNAGTMAQEVDGWDHIHHAAYRGFVKSVERFIKADPEALEKETEDALRCTPLLLAAMSGNKDTVECLIGLGASLVAQNNENHGVVELAAFKQYVSLLDFFHNMQDARLPVWKLLIKFMSSTMDDEAEAGASCIRVMTDPSTTAEAEANTDQMDHTAHIQIAFDNGVIPAIVKILKSEIADKAKEQVLRVMLNMAAKPEALKQAMSGGLVPPVVKLLKCFTNDVIALAAKVLNELSLNTEYSDVVVQNSALQSLVKVLQTNKDGSVLIESCQAIGTICEANPAHKDTLNGISGAVKSIVALYDSTGEDRTVQQALTVSISKMVEGHPGIQSAFVQEDIAHKLMPLIKLESHR